MCGNIRQERAPGIIPLHRLRAPGVQWHSEMAVRNLNLLTKIWFLIMIRKTIRSQPVYPIDSVCYIIIVTLDEIQCLKITLPILCVIGLQMKWVL